MFSKDIFSKKLTYLRTSHQLTAAQLASILGLARPSISQFESGKNLPQFTTLANIADLYGVSVDWLLDRSSSTYNEDILSHLESELWYDIDGYVPESPIPKLPYTIDYKNADPSIPNKYRLLLTSLLSTAPAGDISHYQRSASREEIYSRSVRANIIFCLKLLWFFAECLDKAEAALSIPKKLISSKEFLDAKEAFWTEWQTTLAEASSNRVAKEWVQLFRKCYNLLDDYLIKKDNGEFKLSPKDDIFAPFYVV